MIRYDNSKVQILKGNNQFQQPLIFLFDFKHLFNPSSRTNLRHSKHPFFLFQILRVINSSFFGFLKLIYMVFPMRQILLFFLFHNHLEQNNRFRNNLFHRIQEKNKINGKREGRVQKRRSDSQNHHCLSKLLLFKSQFQSNPPYIQIRGNKTTNQNQSLSK